MAVAATVARASFSDRIKSFLANSKYIVQAVFTINSVMNKRCIISNVASAMAMACSVYIIVSILYWSKIYNISATNPIILIGYVSLVHVIALPMVSAALTCPKFSGSLFNAVLWLNGIWLVGIIILLILMNFVLDDSIKTLWTENPLNHIILAIYFLSALILELTVFFLVHRSGEKTSGSKSTSKSREETDVEANKKSRDKKPAKSPKAKAKTPEVVSAPPSDTPASDAPESEAPPSEAPPSSAPPSEQVSEAPASTASPSAMSTSPPNPPPRSPKKSPERPPSPKPGSKRARKANSV